MIWLFDMHVIKSFIHLHNLIEVECLSLYILFDVKKKSTLNKLNAYFCIISDKMYGMGRMWTLMLVKADKTTFKAYKTKVKNCNKY